MADETVTRQGGERYARALTPLTPTPRLQFVGSSLRSSVRVLLAVLLSGAMGAASAQGDASKE